MDVIALFERGQHGLPLNFVLDVLGKSKRLNPSSFSPNFKECMIHKSFYIVQCCEKVFAIV